ncbi:hypothetical protein [Silanimonas sp.]|jgi:hypothetical protein|uniref:hypothetical protein n=1 Tax=Silanimonas sp. TaxID=1929290 RepID=UPI0022C97692|nr:hypothetical protein [Silanimonas sp.]MCZ8167491.1 hypothetical protein [Silanimonas sp.]
MLNSGQRRIRALASLLMGIFVVATLCAPTAPANKLVFVGLMALTLAAGLARPTQLRVPTIAPLVVIAAFVYGFGLSLVNWVDDELSQQFALASTVLVLIYPVIWFRIDFDQIVKIGGIAICGLTALSFVFIVFLTDSAVSAVFLDLFVEYSLGAIGERDFLDDPVAMFSLGSTPFLFCAFCVFCRDFMRLHRFRDLLMVFIIILTVLLSTSRGTLIVCIAAFVFLLLCELNGQARWILALLFGAITLVLGIYLSSQTDFFSLGETSNAIKVGHATSFFDNLTLTRSIIGQGLGAYYFSGGRDEFVAHTEITLFDMFRYLGVPVTAVVFAALWVPQHSWARTPVHSARYAVLFGLYLLLSLTNPVLFNSYGLLVVVWYWWHVLRTDTHHEPQRGLAGERA